MFCQQLSHISLVAVTTIIEAALQIELERTATTKYNKKNFINHESDANETTKELSWIS